MNRLPLEILTGIAAELSSTLDVRNFRLSSYRCSVAGFPVLLRHVHVMNTVDCLEEAKILCSSNAGSSRVVKHVTVYHGTWPNIDSLRVWLTHPLLHGQKTRPRLGTACAFREYKTFVQREATRTTSSDAGCFDRFFSSFPNLNSVTISHVYHWDKRKLANAQFERLTNTLRLMPKFEGIINSAVSDILPVLQRRPLVRDLTIRGLLDPNTIEFNHCPSIVRLRVHSLTYQARSENVRQFLTSFPSLKDLSLQGDSSSSTPPLFEQRLPIQGLTWPRLVQASFTNFCTSEDELVDFVQQHNLLQLVLLERIRLCTGTWRSFFARVHDRSTSPDIRLNDTLSTSPFPLTFQDAWRDGLVA